MEVGQKGKGGHSSLSQINVTPFVDVMLVLLIIFMVTAPMMEKGVDVDLPEVENAPNMEAKNEPLVVTVEKGGAIFLGRSRVESAEQLTPALIRVLEGREGKEVVLEADREVDYGKVVLVMAAIKKAGVEKLGLVAQEPQT